MTFALPAGGDLPPGGTIRVRAPEGFSFRPGMDTQTLPDNAAVTVRARVSGGGQGPTAFCFFLNSDPGAVYFRQAVEVAVEWAAAPSRPARPREVSGVLADIVIPSGLPAVQYFAVGLVVENPATPSAAAESRRGRRDAMARPQRILPFWAGSNTTDIVQQHVVVSEGNSTF